MELRTDHATTLAASQPKMIDDVLSSLKKAVLSVSVTDKIKMADLIESMFVGGLAGAGTANGVDPLERAQRQVISAQLEGLIDSYVSTKAHEGDLRYNVVSVAVRLHELESNISFKIGEWISKCDLSSKQSWGLKSDDVVEKATTAIRTAVELAATVQLPSSQKTQDR